MNAEKMGQRVLAALLATVAGVILAWSVWMLSFLVGVGYKDSSDQLYVAYGGTGLLLATALATTSALIFLPRLRGSMWLWLAGGSLVANAFPYIVGYQTQPDDWIVFHSTLLLVAFGAMVGFRAQGGRNDTEMPR